MFKKGFTLIELLIVIAIIAILAGVVFVSLNPLKRFQDARNSARWTDVTAVLSAIKVHQVDNEGSYLSPAITALTADTKYMIGTAAPAPATCPNTNCAVITAGNCVDLTDLTTDPNSYLGRIPVSPNGAGSWSTALSGYYMSRNTNGSITVAACDAEGSPPPAISVNR